MKFLSILLIGLLLLGMPSTASAISLTIKAAVASGTSLGTHTLIACNGYNYNTAGDPWTQAACYSKTAGGTTLQFGGKNGAVNLVTRLYNSAGTDIGGAGCFYGANFFIVYLFPDAWGGAGYQLSQAAATFPSPIDLATVLTPVYSGEDKFCWGSPQVCVRQDDAPMGGPLTSTELSYNPQLNTSVLAKNGSLILKAYRPRIVRAEYGIPPKPGTGQTRPTGWVAIPLTTAAGTYQATVSITLTAI